MVFVLNFVSRKVIFCVVLIVCLQSAVANGFPDRTNDQVSARKSLGAAEQACAASKKLMAEDSSDTNSQFPFMASLGYIHLENGKYSVRFECRGTIISDYFILIAAHCAPPSRLPSVVRLGKLEDDVDDDVDDEVEESVNLQIQEIIRHPEYSQTAKHNDIALIRVAEPISLSNIASPACLQTDVRDESADVKLIWPKTDNNRNFLVSMPWAECNEKFLELNLNKNLGVRGGLHRGQYCAYDPQQRDHTCNGDSGAPLLHFKNSKVPTVIGIVSFSIGCNNDFPTVHTRVAYYLDWIESVVWPNGFMQQAF